MVNISNLNILLLVNCKYLQLKHSIPLLNIPYLTVYSLLNMFDFTHLNKYPLEYR